MTILFKKAKIYPITDECFVGDLLVKDGKIASIGQNIYSGASEVVDASGKYIFPGFIDAHSHVGIYEEEVGGQYGDGNEMTNPVTPEVSVVDAFYPNDPSIKRALSGGVTTAMVLPGSANPIGGQGAIFKFKNIPIVDKMAIKKLAGLKMATGENPKRVYGIEKKQMPLTRLGIASIIKDFFIKVQNYKLKKEKAESEGIPFSDVNSQMEVGLKVLNKEIPARIHAHRMDDILTAVRIAEEFDFKVIIEHATEGYKIADFLKEKNIPVVLGPLFGFRTKLELKDMTFEAIKIINEKGILAAMMCDHPVIPLESTTIQLGTALRYGANEENLLKMITINPAKILGIDDRVGSLEPGKDADFSIWSGHPFEFRSQVESVFIEGEKVL